MTTHVDCPNLQNELRDVEEKFRKAMVTNASLDNEKAQLTYQVDLLKDQLEEREEQNALVVRELREKNREFELMKRSYAEAQRAVQLLQVSKLALTDFEPEPTTEIVNDEIWDL